MAEKRAGNRRRDQFGTGVPQQKKTAKSAPGGPAGRVLRLLGSLKLAVVLLAVSMLVLIPATLVDSEFGLKVAKRYIYQSPWFIGLAFLLAVNVLAAALLRFPWKIRHLGFLVTHFGLLVLLAGSMQTFLQGYEGRLRIEEGRSADSFEVTDLSVLTTSWNEGKPNVVDFPVPTGPTFWSHGTTGHLGEMDGVSVSVLEFCRHAEFRQGEFLPSELEPGKAELLEPAALFEITVDGQAQELWLQRRTRMLGSSRIMTPKGPMLVTFGSPPRRMGFSLKLLDFVREQNPGGMGNAGFSSFIEVIDEAEKLTRQYEISMNRPLTYRGFTFYQSEWRNVDGQDSVSILSVAYDPGTVLKYTGCLMICVGTFIIFYLQGWLSKRFRPAAAETEDPQPKR